MLINPPLDNQYPQPPLGLAYIASVLERHGHHVRVLDMPALRLPDFSITEVIRLLKPDIVGITAMTPAIDSAINIANQVKTADPNILVVLGGNHATSLPEETLQCSLDIDLVIRGEGEQTFLDLVSTYEKNLAEVKKISGLTYREDGAIKSNQLRPPIDDLDTLPFPAFHLLPLKKYRMHPPFGRKKPVIPIITSRGCPYRCLFCSKSVFGKKYRFNSASYVVSEIEFLIEHFDVGEIKFYDDSFTLNQSRVFELCRLLKKKKVDIQWTCETRVDLVNRNLLEVMKGAGCYMIQYGVESGVQEILNTLKKDTTLSQIREAFELTHDSGIETVAYFMLGSPGESSKTIEETIDFAKRLDPDFAQFSVMIALPGTELFSSTFESMQNESQWGHFVYSDLNSVDAASFGSKFMDRSELSSWNKRAYLDFYLRLGYLLKRLKKTRSLGALKTNACGLKMLLQSA